MIPGFSRCRLLGLLLMALLGVPGCSEKIENRDFSAGWDPGLIRHDLLLSYNGKIDLTEVHMQINLVRKDGQRISEKRVLAKWKTGQTERFNLPAHDYQKMELRGNAKRDHKNVKFDTYWNQEWKN